MRSGEAERCNYEIDCREKKASSGSMGSHVLTIGISATTFRRGRRGEGEGLGTRSRKVIGFRRGCGHQSLTYLLASQRVDVSSFLTKREKLSGDSTVRIKIWLQWYEGTICLLLLDVLALGLTGSSIPCVRFVLKKGLLVIYSLSRSALILLCQKASVAGAFVSCLCRRPPANRHLQASV